MVVVFDFDGTLADSDLIINKCFEYVLIKHPLTITREQILAMYGPTEEGILAKIYGRELGSKYYKEDYVPYYFESHKELLPNPVKGIKEILDFLYNKVDIFLLSGRNTETTKISLKNFEFEKYFRDIFTGSIKGVNKPESFRYLMDKYDLKPQDIVYIGDSKNDILNCKELGIEIISVTYCNPNSFDKLRILEPNHIVKSTNELFEELKKKIA